MPTRAHPLRGVATALGATLLLSACSGSSGTARGNASLPPAPAATTGAISSSDGAAPSSGSDSPPASSSAPTESSPSAPPTQTTAQSTAQTAPPGATTPPAAGATGSPPASVGAAGGRCTASGLRLSLGAASGAAGSVYRTLVLTNSTSASCTLTGYPGVSYVTGDAGSQVGAPAARTGASAATVTLAPSGTASSQLQSVDAGAFPPARCRPTAVRGLRVYPPGSTDALYAPLPDGQQACQDPSIGQLRNGALVAGADG